jgi:single-stranded DNA-binding protein
MWGKRSESKLFDHLGKGSKVTVHGEVDLDVYTKGSGEQGASITVKIGELDLNEGKPNGNVQHQPAAQPAAQQNAQASAKAAVDDEDWNKDIPF